MKLILTEKPNVTKQVKAVLAPRAKYIKCGGATGEPLGYYEDSSYVICNTVGHCVGIKSPQDINPSFTWDLSQLPYAFPNELPLEIVNSKQNNKKALFDVIQECFAKYNYEEVIIATDGDREGQNIWRKINLMLRPFKSHAINRVWLSEWTPEGIQEAFDNRFPNSDKKTLEDAAQCREEADYIIGMNCSVALTKKYVREKGNVASIGRVMGPTMYIVYNREKEIQTFKPEPYTTLAIKTSTDENNDLILKMKRQDKISSSEALKIENKLKALKTVNLNKVTNKIFRRSPELYDATTIAQDMNKRYGYSAKKTADIIQKLYQDYALTTYPGTNARKISEGSAKKVYQILNNLTMYGDIIDEIKDKRWGVSKHVVTKEGLAHEAITPVYGSIDKAKIAKLTKEEMNVYKAIIERFLAAFYPKTEFEEVVVSTTAGDEIFEAKGKTLLCSGWMKVLGMPSDTLLPKITDGQLYKVKEILKENKKTTAPVRYTEETLLSAMKNAGRFVADSKEAAILNSKEVEGLGTGRTRPAIIENIKNKGYFVIERKYIHPTEKCIDLFNVLPNTTLSSPSLTAKFEQMIQNVEDGKMTRSEYMKKINNEVIEIINMIKSDTSGKIIGTSKKETTKNKKGEIGICPLCGGEVIENNKAFGCKNWKTGCKFTIWKNQKGKELKESQIKALLSKGKTPLIKGMKTQLGKEYDGYLEFLKNDDGSINYSKLAIVKDNKNTKFIQKTSIGICPICSNELTENSDTYSCNCCNTKIYKNALARFGKKQVEIKEAIKLFNDEIIEVEFISSKTGNPYKKKVFYDKASGWIKVKW